MSFKSNFINVRSFTWHLELFLFSLMRLCTNSTLDSLAKNTFGRDYSVWSRVFNWFLLHLHELFYDLMHNNLDFWVPYFPACAAAIRSKLLEHGLHFTDDEIFLIFSFIDDNCFETCRPRGPVETKALRVPCRKRFTIGGNPCMAWNSRPWTFRMVWPRTCSDQDH